jgi:hypothetical protein
LISIDPNGSSETDFIRQNTVKTTMKTTAFKDKSARRFITPSLTLSAAALGVSAAHGAVVVSDFADVTDTGQRTRFEFDTFTGVATPGYTGVLTSIDFMASTYDSKFGSWSSAIADLGSPSSAIVSTPFLSGDTVDASGNFQSMFFTLQSNLTDAYFGVRMTGGDGAHYGWIKVSTGPEGASGNGRPVSITIHSAALETTANTAITIPSAVPEPSSVLLLGLAAGAGAFRRRRQAA